MFQPLTGAKTKKLVEKAARATHRAAFDDVEKGLSTKEKKKAEQRTLKAAAQKSTKAARKRGGFTRGGNYDVEDLAGLENIQVKCDSSSDSNIELASSNYSASSSDSEPESDAEFEPRPDSSYMPGKGVSSGDSVGSDSDNSDFERLAMESALRKKEQELEKLKEDQKRAESSVPTNADQCKPKSRFAARMAERNANNTAESKPKSRFAAKMEERRKQKEEAEEEKEEKPASKPQFESATTSTRASTQPSQPAFEPQSPSSSSDSAPELVIEETHDYTEEELILLKPFEVRPSQIPHIQGQLSILLRHWSNDGSDVATQSSRVRKLIASWHPDKQHRHGVDAVHVAKEIFQFLQETITAILSEKGLKEFAAKLLEQDQETKQHVDRAQKLAKAHARVAAIQEKEAIKAEKLAAKEEKKERKKNAGNKKNKKKQKQREEAEVSASEESLSDAESVISNTEIMIYEGPKHAMLRLWPRSHFSVTSSPLLSEGGEFYIFAGEWYDGRKATFYSDLYKVNMALGEEKPAPAFHQLYSAIPGRPGPTPRSSHQTVGHDGNLYVFGGEWASENLRRYRQFNDLWCFDIKSLSWKEIKSENAPCKRSGHRSCVVGDKLLVFGGFTEKQNGEEEYHSDLHIFDIPSQTWMSASQRAKLMKGKDRPDARSGCLFWADNVPVDEKKTARRAWLYGGIRPAKGMRKKNVGLARSMDKLADLWCLDVPTLTWTKITISNDSVGPGARSGLASCNWTSTKRMIFGGVTDLPMDDPRRTDGSVALFHNDLWSLELPPIPASNKKYGSAKWHQLWSPLIKGIRLADLLALPDAQKGGGVDVLALVDETQGTKKSLAKGPRGRISAQLACVGGYVYVFGGAAEAGHRKEATLDDMWRIDLTGQAVKNKWQNILPLSERCSVWFDDDSESDSDDDENLKEKKAIVVPKQG